MRHAKWRDFLAEPDVPRDLLAVAAGADHIPGMAGSDLPPDDQRQYRRDTARVERGFWRKIRRHGRRVPFLADALAAYFCAVDPKTPIQVKAVLMAALAYFVLPADLVPDIVAWLGFTDDAAVFYAALRTIAPHVTDGHRRRAQGVIDRIAPAEPEEAAPR